ncbi:MAG: hypothetical protein ACYCXW_13080 [Solirubrobacteraceae bacterium]
MLVQVGAGLRAQESLVSTVKGIASRYGTRASVLRELDRCESRGATARNGMERQLHRSRSQLERQVRAMRHDFEREARAVRRDLGRRSAGAQKLARRAQERITALT